MTQRGHLTPLSENRHLKVSEEDPDVRGWDVFGADGQRIGTIRDLMIDMERMKVEYFAVGDGQIDDVMVPAASARVDTRTRQVFVPETGTGPGGTYEPGERGAEYGRDRSYGGYDRELSPERREGRLTRAEEDVHIGKRQVESGELVVGKHVETERIREDVPIERERARIERRPVADEPLGAAEMQDEEIRVPLREEEVVIEKRPVTREELVIGKERIQDTETVETDVRRERFDIRGADDAAGETPSRRRRRE